MVYIEFGKIVNTHGIKGEIKVYSYTDNPNNILNLKRIYIDNVKYCIENIRYISNIFIIKLKGINSIENTKSIMNKEIYREIQKKELHSKQEFFIKDLVGMQVFDENNIYIGKLKEVFNTRANDVYVITRENKQDLLLPAIKQVIKDINIEKCKMVVNIMEGLDKWSLQF